MPAFERRRADHPYSDDASPQLQQERQSSQQWPYSATPRITRQPSVTSGANEDMDESLDHIIMAVDRTFQGHLGCAYYVARHELLYCMEDVDRIGKEVIETSSGHRYPTNGPPGVGSCSRGKWPGWEAKATIRLEPWLEKNLENWLVLTRIPDTDNRPPPYNEIVRPTTEFNYINGLRRLCNVSLVRPEDTFQLWVPGEEVIYDDMDHFHEVGLTDQPGHLLAIAAHINIDCKISIGCAGVVLGYLQRKRTSEFLQNDPLAAEAYRVSNLEMFTLKNTMLVNIDTLMALQIIQTESHPSISSQGPGTWGTKESLSIYGLFHTFAKTPQGRSRLRQVFLRPSLDLTEIAYRHNFISILMRPENQDMSERLSKSLSRIVNMRSTMISLRKGIERGTNSSGKIKANVWNSLLEFCYHAIEIADALREISGLQKHDIFITAEEVLEKTRLKRIGLMIHNVINIDESSEQRRSIINRGIDEDLDRVKDVYEGMEDKLSEIASEISHTMPMHISARLNILFLPQLGYHIVVPFHNSTRQPIWDGGDERWERRFTTSENVYFKSERMREMDLQWGDTYAIICDREIEHSHGLAQQVLEDEQSLIKASDLCGELDYMLALAHGAVQYKLTRPRIIEQNVIDVKAGRHLLQEMTIPSYVPNDISLIGGDDTQNLERPSMLLLTGPNYSGKSVYMKQVALIVYMAQIGSFVPAESATLGITDKILTRINTAETVSRIQSAFMTDLQQIAQCLKACTRKSLVIIDEFGKGTHTCDGAGLFSGVIQYLLRLESDSPKILASTHFHEIFERGDFDHQRNLALAHMEVRMEERKSTVENDSQAIYLYNIRAGRSTGSYGNQCAAMNGIPKEVINRAMLLTDLTVKGVDLVSTCASLPEEELKELEDAEAISRRFLQTSLTEIHVRNLLNESFRTDQGDPQP